MPFLVIREAQPADARTVCELIRELAAFEKLSAEAEPDPETLARQLKPDASPRVRCLLIERDKETVGFALYYYAYSTFKTNWGIHLEDIYVRAEYRGRGYARMLIREIARTAVAEKRLRLELNVLTWNTESIGIYAHLGARELSDWVRMRFEIEALKALDSGW